MKKVESKCVLLFYVIFIVENRAVNKIMNLIILIRCTNESIVNVYIIVKADSLLYVF